MCCCKKILNFCTLANACIGKLSLGVNAAVSGEYILRVEFLGTIFIIKRDFSQGDELEFPVNLLNENYRFLGRVYGPGGETVFLTVDGIDYECFSFKTGFSYNTEVVGDFSDDYSNDFFI